MKKKKKDFTDHKKGMLFGVITNELIKTSFSSNVSSFVFTANNHNCHEQEILHDFN